MSERVASELKPFGEKHALAATDQVLVIIARSFVGKGAKFGRLMLSGGMLLNCDKEVVDKIRETVYEGERVAGKLVGESTIFAGAVRR